MPMYTCTSPAGTLDERQKGAIATAITEIHHQATGAPRSFVDIIFYEVAPGDTFRGGDREPVSFINGNIRAGRPQAVVQGMLVDIDNAWRQIVGKSTGNLFIHMLEIPSKSLMENGHLGVEPGSPVEKRIAAEEEQARRAEPVRRP
ncbi:tautomerase family protein [Nocardia sp. NPDC051570]|uniref:tautomerase family protein n=1 Tax=Nocardia sp. NPDC051570 TaxID=3364324 RepID=UPI0037B6261C